MFLAGRGNEKLEKEAGEVWCLGVSKTTELPVEDWREELRDQPLVIWLKLLGIHGFVRFGVEVVRVEGPDGSQRLLVGLVGQMAVRALPVPSRTIKKRHEEWYRKRERC